VRRPDWKSHRPLIFRKDGTGYCHVFGKDYRFHHDEKEIEEMKSKIRFSGYHPYVCDEEELKELERHPVKVDRLFDKLMAEELGRMIIR